MVFTYETAPFDDIARVRLMISDTNAADYQFEDAEITAFLTLANSSLLLASSYALESWAASLTDGLAAEKIGDYSYQKKSVENKMALAKKYREEDATSPVFEWSEWNLAAGSGITAEED